MKQDNKQITSVTQIEFLGEFTHSNKPEWRTRDEFQCLTKASLSLKLRLSVHFIRLSLTLNHKSLSIVVQGLLKLFPISERLHQRRAAGRGRWSVDRGPWIDGLAEVGVGSFIEVGRT